MDLAAAMWKGIEQAFFLSWAGITSPSFPLFFFTLDTPLESQHEA